MSTENDSTSIDSRFFLQEREYVPTPICFGKLISESFLCVMRNLIPFYFASLVLILLSLGLGMLFQSYFVAGKIDSSLVPGYAWAILAAYFLITAFLSVGNFRIALLAFRGMKPSVGTLFSGVNCLGRSIAAWVIAGLYTIVVGIAMGILFLGVSVFGRQVLFAYGSVSVFFFVFLIYLLFIGLILKIFMYLPMVSDSNISPFKAFNDSQKLSLRRNILLVLIFYAGLGILKVGYSIVLPFLAEAILPLSPEQLLDFLYYMNMLGIFIAQPVIISFTAGYYLLGSGQLNQ